LRWTSIGLRLPASLHPLLALRLRRALLALRAHVLSKPPVRCEFLDYDVYARREPAAQAREEAKTLARAAGSRTVEDPCLRCGLTYYRSPLLALRAHTIASLIQFADGLMVLPGCCKLKRMKPLFSLPRVVSESMPASMSSKYMTAISVPPNKPLP